MFDRVRRSGAVACLQRRRGKRFSRAEGISECRRLRSRASRDPALAEFARLGGYSQQLGKAIAIQTVAEKIALHFVAIQFA